MTTGEPSFIAADLVAQAEHDPDALVLLITTIAQAWRSAVARSVAALAQGNPIAQQSLRKHGAVLVAKSRGTGAWTGRIGSRRNI